MSRALPGFGHTSRESWLGGVTVGLVAMLTALSSLQVAYGQPQAHRDCQPIKYGNITHEAWPSDKSTASPMAATRTFVSYIHPEVVVRAWGHQQQRQPGGTDHTVLGHGAASSEQAAPMAQECHATLTVSPSVVAASQQDLVPLPCLLRGVNLPGGCRFG